MGEMAESDAFETIMVMTMDKTSMRWWYPNIKDMNIPQPKTEIIPPKREVDLTALMSDEEADTMSEKSIREYIDIPAVEAACEKMGYPVFMRSDYTSHKHDWKRSCFVTCKEDIIPHIQNILEFSVLADIFGGIPFTAVVIREYIPMAQIFTAFGREMPVNPEWRFFVHKGQILCSHWYWTEPAIRQPSIRTWKNRMYKARHASIDNGGFKKIESYAWAISAFVGGSWSIDFCLGANGTWYLIDMAESYKSWHPEDCPNHKTIKNPNLS